MSNYHHEKWEDFGNNLKSYIDSNVEELNRDSYDVILGFSRGGTILAYAFACLLKDVLVDGYSDLPKASVRSIPKGVTSKNNEPCFVMDHPASRSEKKDITDILEKDLEEFSKNHNQSKQINVLIMDDNLTGATRVGFLESKLNAMDCVKEVKTLAYVRHPSFPPMSTIAKFPEGKDYFVMPWHGYHEKMDLGVLYKKVDSPKLRIFIKSSDKVDLQDFREELSESYIIRGNLIYNGASVFLFKEINTNNDNFIELRPVCEMLYPPKQCLKPKNSDSNANAHREFSLCSLAAEKTMAVCFVCTYLNCNIELFKEIMRITGNCLIKVEIDKNSNTNTNLKAAVEGWLRLRVDAGAFK